MVVIFSDGFETDQTFALWSSVLTCDTFVYEQARVHAGIWAVEGTIIPGCKFSLISKALGLLPTVYGRNYVNFGSYFDNTGNAISFNFLNLQGGDFAVVMALYNDSGINKFYTGYHDTGGQHFNILSSPLPALNQWYCIEIAANIAAGSGWASAWIDGVQVLNAINLTNNDENNIISWYTGWQSGGSPITNPLIGYFDDVQLSDQYNGPMGGAWIQFVS